jgi:hypothetical protein
MSYELGGAPDGEMGACVSSFCLAMHCATPSWMTMPSSMQGMKARTTCATLLESREEEDYSGLFE